MDSKNILKNPLKFNTAALWQSQSVKTSFNLRSEICNPKFVPLRVLCVLCGQMNPCPLQKFPGNLCPVR